MEPFAAIERSHGWNAGDLPLVQVQVLIYRLSGEERRLCPVLLASFSSRFLMAGSANAEVVEDMSFIGCD